MLIKGWKSRDFLGVQKQNFWSDQKGQLYAVTFYKVTQLPRESFCLSYVIKVKTWENRVLYDTKDL